MVQLRKHTQQSLTSLTRSAQSKQIGVKDSIYKIWYPTKSHALEGSLRSEDYQTKEKGRFPVRVYRYMTIKWHPWQRVLSLTAGVQPLSSSLSNIMCYSLLRVCTRSISPCWYQHQALGSSSCFMVWEVLPSMQCLSLCLSLRRGSSQCKRLTGRWRFERSQLFLWYMCRPPRRLPWWHWAQDNNITHVWHATPSHMIHL